MMNNFEFVLMKKMNVQECAFKHFLLQALKKSVIYKVYSRVPKLPL